MPNTCGLVASVKLLDSLTFSKHAIQCAEYMETNIHDIDSRQYIFHNTSEILSYNTDYLQKYIMFS